MTDYKPIKSAAVRVCCGIVFVGKNHAEILQNIAKHSYLPREYRHIRQEQMGFITEDDIFVDRDLALKIALKHDQIKQKYKPNDRLLSEDLTMQ